MTADPGIGTRGEYMRQILLVSEREREAARGGNVWGRFVRWAEDLTGMPWETIRVELNALHKFQERQLEKARKGKP